MSDQPVDDLDLGNVFGPAHQLEDHAVAGLPGGTYALLEVEDTGTGMTEDVQTHIFEPYFTRKVSGWGIGLSQIEGLIGQYYEGSLELAHDGPLPGATFRIMLRGSA